MNLDQQLAAELIAKMRNKAMANKLLKGKALDVRAEGRENGPGLYELRRFVDGVDYCDAQREAWIWSIGRRRSDGAIFAATDTRFYSGRPNEGDYECLWLR